MLHSRKPKIAIFKVNESQTTSVIDRLRYAASCKLCVWHHHRAGGGSLYITIGDTFKLRFADHQNTSSKYNEPDFNFVKRTPTEQEVLEIEARIQYPRLCKKTALAKHVGLTVPRLKKLLTPECFKNVCENGAYPNTLTQYVVVAVALAELEIAGITERIPVLQEIYSQEDYSGD